MIADGSMVILAETNASVAIGNKLKVGGTPRYLTVTSTRSVYMRFDLSGLTGSIASARVRLRRSTAARGKKAGFQVQATPVAGDDWKEYELNGTAAPAPGQVLATWESTVKTPEFDVTAQVRAALAADKKLLIRISRAEGKDKQFFTYQSKDAGTGKEGPRLIVVPEK